MIPNSATPEAIVLPQKWSKIVVPRKNPSKNRHDVYLITPCGRRLKSKQHLQNYIAKNQISIDPTVINFSKPSAEDGGDSKVNKNSIEEALMHEMREKWRLRRKNAVLLVENKTLRSSNAEYERRNKELEVALENTLCKICYAAEVRMVLEPCRHAFCSACTEKINRCGLCFETILNTEVIFLC